MNGYLLSIDEGNSSIKIGLFDRHGQQIGIKSCSNIHLISEEPGFEMYDPELLWREVGKKIDDLIRTSGINPKQICGMGISAYGNGLVILGADGRPIDNGIYSNDYRANALAESLAGNDDGRKIRRLTQAGLWGGQTGMLLKWYKHYRPEIYTQIRHILLPGGFFIYKLTGNYVSEKNSMSGSSLLDMERADYSRELMKLYGIEEMYPYLPELKEKGSDIAGYVTGEAERLTGIPAGTPVTAGMMDNMACFVGCGADVPGTVNMIAGSWCVNQTVSEKILPGASANMFHVYPGRYLNCSWSGASANNLEWFVKNFGAALAKASDCGRNEVYSRIDGVLSKLDETSGIFYLPFIAQPSVHPEAKACFVGIELNTSAEKMLRALAEGIVFMHKYHMEFLERGSGQPEKVRLTGGISKSAAWGQLFADILEVPVEITACEETGVLGAAIAAGVGTGVYASYSEAYRECVRTARTYWPQKERAVKDYRKKYKKWRRLAETMTGFWEK